LWKFLRVFRGKPDPLTQVATQPMETGTMKVAIVYNRESQRVINLFGMPNREKYGLKSINRIKDALRKGGHQVETFEGDKDLIDRLEEFMPRVMKHERPGMVFNLSYGIQGQARYTHVPGMLEMIGLPYVGSGPLAHSLALDKVVSKMIFVQHGLPTPDFAVLDAAGFDMPDVKFPLIVKPKNEAVSFGIKIVRSEKELREAADVIFKEFQQPVLAEQYIAGREVNVGLLGNNPTEALPPAEIMFGTGGPQIYTYEDKTRKSGRDIGVECPAKLDAETTAKAQQIAKRAFEVLGCFDCARVDMRLDKDGNLYILEVNSLPSMGEHGSYVQGAATVGLDFPGLVNRLVEVAAARYFGTPNPPELSSPRDGSSRIHAFLTSNRDTCEKELKEWSLLRSRTTDPVGTQEAIKRLDKDLRAIGLKAVDDLTDSHVAWTWQTPAGMDGGTLLIGHLDVPLEPEVATQTYRREPEWLYGEGIGASRAPLVSMLFALRALRHVRKLRRLPLGVLYYGDEGRDCRYSVDTIRKAAARVKNVLVLRPGHPGDFIVTARRGQRRYLLTIDGETFRMGGSTKKPEVLTWAFDKLQQCGKLSSRKERTAVSTLALQTTHMPMLLPHHVTATLLASYPDEKIGASLEERLRDIFAGDSKGIAWKLELFSSRPPMKERRANARLSKALDAVAKEWEIPLRRESSVWPSAAGLVPASTGVVCGVGPVARNVYTPSESVDRISLLQRTLLLAEFLGK
jgi:D-alanine-D-alanine ligase